MNICFYRVALGNITEIRNDLRLVGHDEWAFAKFVLNAVVTYHLLRQSEQVTQLLHWNYLLLIFGLLEFAAWTCHWHLHQVFQVDVSWTAIVLLSLEIAVKHTFRFLSSLQLIQHQLAFKLTQGQQLGCLLRLGLLLFEFEVKETIDLFSYIYLRVGHHESLFTRVVGRADWILQDVYSFFAVLEILDHQLEFLKLVLLRLSKLNIILVAPVQPALAPLHLPHHRFYFVDPLLVHLLSLHLLKLKHLICIGLPRDLFLLA